MVEDVMKPVIVAEDEDQLVSVARITGPDRHEDGLVCAIAIMFKGDETMESGIVLMLDEDKLEAMIQALIDTRTEIQ
jgi:hypothetical protein